MAKKQLVVWFDDKGNLLEQAGTWTANYVSQYGYKSEEAKDFDDDMELIRVKEYRRKNTRVVLKSTTTGRTYYMYVDDFNKVIEAKRFSNLHLSGTFHFIKKSSGQAVQLILEPKP